MAERTATRLDLSGRVALVTGGTRGVGLAVARKLRACGADVLLNYAHSDDDAKLALDHLDGLPGSSRAIRADVGDPGAFAAMLDRIRDETGRVDAFVHCAVAFHRAATTSAAGEGLASAQAVALGPFLHGAAGLAGLLPSGGRVVALSSSGAHAVVPGYAGQGIAKAGLEAAVRYLAVELAARGITVNVVSAARIGTGIPETRELETRLRARTPAGRLSTPEDVAGVVALLCSDEAGWLHGQILHADGGLGLMA